MLYAKILTILLLLVKHKIKISYYFENQKFEKTFSSCLVKTKGNDCVKRKTITCVCLYKE